MHRFFWQKQNISKLLPTLERTTNLYLAHISLFLCFFAAEKNRAALLINPEPPPEAIFFEDLSQSFNIAIGIYNTNAILPFKLHK